MPEKPEAQTMTDKLNSDLAGYYLTQFTLQSDKFEITNLNKLQTLLPRGIVRIFSRGKKVIWELEGGIFIVTSLGMTGRWVYSQLPHVRVCATLAAIEGNTVTPIGNVYFDDQRMIGGNIELAFDLDQVKQLLKNVGPDLLLDDITFDYFYSILKAAPNWVITKFLKEQKYFSGIGNYLVAEILYRARVRPDRKLANLSLDECKRLWEESRNTIYESYMLGGFTIERFLDPSGNSGSFVAQVYGRSADKYGNTVVAARFKGDKMVDPSEQKSGQTIWWVPAIQV